MGNWVARPMNDSMQPPIPPPSGMPPPPPQRSRLQNVWGAAPAPPTMNNSAVNGMFMPPPPDVDFNIHNGMNQWNQPARTNAGGAVVPVVPKPAFTPSFVNRSPPPGSSFNSYPPISQTDSFMGENAVWQDPEGEKKLNDGWYQLGKNLKQQKVKVMAGWDNRASLGSTKTSTTIPTIWDLISDQQRSALELSWTQTPDSINAGVMPAPTQQIVGQLRQAVTKDICSILIEEPQF
ncbi:unnamed protein product [Gongylonema pulchrum]|uniref:TNRC6-PABC_bdg domain-containing protein n=1 Tax=Gongylonema pulchrum TaxID=637853 RepID=A0A183E8V0_9BILA|nr:unnamed protein product [Gongylonema pulchrum]